MDVVGYDQRPFGRHLTRHDLDAVSAGRRVYAIHTSGHAHLVNTAVLDAIGACAGSGVVRGADGTPTGLFLEEATRWPNAVRTPFSVHELSAAVAAAARVCAAQGITFAAEAGLGGGLVTRSPVEALAFQRADAALRLQLMPSLDLIAPDRRPTARTGSTTPSCSGCAPGSVRTGSRLGATKTWLDGGMMARTAALTDPYVEDGPARVRRALGRPRRAVRPRGAGARRRLAARAACHRRPRRRRRARDRRAGSAGPAAPGARHRIEHAGLVRPDQLPRLAAAGVTVVTQPTFLYEFGDDYAEIMGPDRAGWLYRGWSYLDHGIALAGSSDRPVADGAPLRAVRFLVDRRTSSGRRVGADEALSVAQALAAYTTGGARACGVEDRLGSLTPGRYADVVVLDADPHDVPPHDLADISVLATAVGGDLTHGAWPG